MVELAVSNDANPLDGFSTQFLVPVSAAGTVADFPKYGYNADAFVIEANEFGDGHSVVTVIDKAQLLAGTLVTYQSTPSFNFRALTPAQMHGASPGDPMWFMASTGDPTYDGTHPNTIRVTKMENILSDSPVYTDYAVGVNTYGPNSGAADQPGGTGLGGHERRLDHAGRLPQRQPGNGLRGQHAGGRIRTTKTHWYQVDVTSGTPTLVQEGLVDPGPGVADLLPLGHAGRRRQHRHHLHAIVVDRVRLGLCGRPHRRARRLGTTTAGTAFGTGDRLDARELPRRRL